MYADWRWLGIEGAGKMGKVQKSIASMNTKRGVLHSLGGGHHRYINPRLFFLNPPPPKDSSTSKDLFIFT